MTSYSNKHQATIYITTSVFMCITGSAIFNLQPLIASTLSHSFDYSAGQTGWLIAIEVSGIAMASLLLPEKILLYGISKSLGFACLVLLLGNLASFLAEHFFILCATRFVTGLLGNGILYITGIMLLSQYKNSVLSFSILIFSNMIFSAISIQLLTALFEPLAWSVLLSHLSLLVLLVLLLSRLCNFNLYKLVKDGQPRKQRLSKRTIRGFLAIFFYTTALGVIWTYTETLFSLASMSLAEMGNTLSMTFVFQAAGAFVSIVLSRRHAYRSAFTMMLAGQIIGMVLISQLNIHGNDTLIYGLSIWGLTWNLGLAFQMGLISNTQQPGYHSGYIPATEASGVAAGSFLPVLFINVYPPEYVISIIAISAILISSVIFYALVFVHK